MPPLRNYFFSAMPSPMRSEPKSFSPSQTWVLADGRRRPCRDFHRLNNATENDRYPTSTFRIFPPISLGPRIFSDIDVVPRYHQVPVHAEDVSKTAVITLFGLFESLCMLFGLKG